MFNVQRLRDRVRCFVRSLARPVSTEYVYRTVELTEIQLKMVERFLRVRRIVGY